MFKIKTIVTRNEERVLESAYKVLNYENIIKQAYSEALVWSIDGKVERTNVIGRMSHIIKGVLNGKVKGYTKYGYAKHLLDVSFQCYQFNIGSDEPLLSEFSEYRANGTPIIYLKSLFDVEAIKRKDNNEVVPLFTKCKSTSYSNAHTMGINWKLFASHLTQEILTIPTLPKEYLLNLFKNSGEYDNSKEGKEYSGKESLVTKILRAQEAIDYIFDEVMDKPLVFSAVPDSRSRVAKYRIFFTDGRELDNQYTWFINFFSESWRTNLYEKFHKKELNEDGLETLKVTAARFWYKQTHMKRLSWRKAKNLFKKNSEEILNVCSNDSGHGIYYPRIAKLINAGIGTMTGFMLEADLSASGIGTAAMNIHSKSMAEVTSLCGKATPADAHRDLVERVMRSVIEDENVIQYWIHKDYKMLKKMNTEITHAQTIKVSADKWTHKLQVEYGIDCPSVTEDILFDVYNDVMPGMLQWIGAITSVTKVGVLKGHSVLSWRAMDGVKCSSSAYTKSRAFSAVAVNKEGKTRRLALVMNMPIELDNKGIVYDGPEGKHNNKMMGAWANFIQADDAFLKRNISKTCKAEHGFVPIVKHDGYYAHVNDVKPMVEAAYEARLFQFREQPIKHGFEQIANFLNIKAIELPTMNMKESDMKMKTPSEACLMMT